MNSLKRITALLLTLFAACALLSCSVKVEENTTTEQALQETKAVSYDYDLADLGNLEYFYTCQEIRYNFSQGNYQSYKGKSVHLLGQYQTNGYHFILFIDPSACCNPVDFEILYNGTYPAAGSSIEITGVFDYYSDEYGTYPCIDVEKMTVIA